MLEIAALHHQSHIEKAMPVLTVHYVTRCLKATTLPIPSKSLRPYTSLPSKTNCTDGLSPSRVPTVYVRESTPAHMRDLLMPEVKSKQSSTTPNKKNESHNREGHPASALLSAVAGNSSQLMLDTGPSTKSWKHTRSDRMNLVVAELTLEHVWH